MHYLKENQNQTKEVDMPSVGGQNFDYTPEGLAAAQQAARAKGQTLSGSKDDVIGMDDAGNKINPLGRSIDSVIGQLFGRPAIPPMTRGDGRIRAEDAQRLIEAGIAPDMGMDDVLDDADDNIDINYGTGFDDDNMAPDALDIASVGGDVGSDIGIGSDSNRRLAGVVAPRKPMEYPDNIASRGALPTPEKGYETPDGTSIFGANIEEAMNADRASGPSLLEQFKNFFGGSNEDMPVPQKQQTANTSSEQTPPPPQVDTQASAMDQARNQPDTFAPPAEPQVVRRIGQVPGAPNLPGMSEGQGGNLLQDLIADLTDPPPLSASSVNPPDPNARNKAVERNNALNQLVPIFMRLLQQGRQS